MSAATQVSLSSGETFYVDASAKDVVAALKGQRYLVPLGSRFVNPSQVAQLFSVPDYPSIHTPEKLED